MAVNDLSKTFGIPSPTETLDLTPQFQTSPETGTLGLEQPSTLTRVGSRLSNNLARMGGYDPMQLSNAEERRQARMAGLRELSYRLSQTAAKLSGDPARMQIAQQQEAQRLEARQDQFKKRQIVEGPNGFKYYVNPDGSYERVFPGLEKDPSVTDSTEFERNTSRLLKLDSLETLTPTQLTEKNILEQKIYGRSEPIPFFNSEGLTAATIDSVEYAKDPKKVLDEMESKGFYTVGTKPPVIPKGLKTPLGTIQDNYLEAKKQLDVVNDLANILVTNPDAFTVSGGLADLFNTAKYQAESALTMADFENFKATDPKEFQRIDNLLDTKYSKELDKISGDRAIAKSIFYKLAYVTAKDLDPSGRLSDNDLKAAMEVIGKLGANVNATLANLENVYNTKTREYQDVYNIRIDSVTDNKELEKAAKYKNLNPFLGGRDWRNAGVTTPSTTTPSSTTSTVPLSPLAQSLLEKYGD